MELKMELKFKLRVSSRGTVENVVIWELQGARNLVFRILEHAPLAIAFQVGRVMFST